MFSIWVFKGLHFKTEVLSCFIHAGPRLIVKSLFQTLDPEFVTFLFPDSYMKVSLLLQNKVIKTKKTEVIKKTSDPNFNESFTFKLQAGSLDTASVTVSALQHISGHKGKWCTDFNL